MGFLLHICRPYIMHKMAIKQEKSSKKYKKVTYYHITKKPIGAIITLKSEVSFSHREKLKKSTRKSL
ncbi:MAG: hypothetical protein GYA88_00865 [Clostridiales bacterium]|nr:hypothetical protein [Clostridiales bacterium]